MWTFLRPVLTARFLRFAAVGCSGVVVNLCVLGVAADVLGMHSNAASAVAILVSISSNFAVNERWTFADTGKRDRGSVARRWLMFHAVSLVGAVVQWLVFVSGNALWAVLLDAPLTVVRADGLCGALGPILDPPDVGRHKYLSQLGGIGVAMLWNFLANFYWTWAKQPPYDERCL